MKSVTTAMVLLASTIGLTTLSAHAQGMGGFGGHKRQQKTDKSDSQPPKADDKAYNAAIKNLPDKPYDPWQGAR